MSQSDSYQVPSHPSGLEMRTQLNIIVAAIIGDNSGPEAPTETYPGMMWGDTTANRLRRRNNTNDDWIDIGPLDDFLGDLRTDIDAMSGKCVLKAGDTMTGQLVMQGTGMRLDQTDGTQGPTFAYDPALGVGYINKAGSAWIFRVDDVGGVNASGGLNVGGGGTFGARVTINNGGELNLHGAASFYMRPGGNGMEWVNNAYNAVVASMDDGGTFSCQDMNARGNVRASGAVFTTDGNLWMPWANDYLSNQLGAKAPNGAQCQYNSGLIEGAAIRDDPSPGAVADFGNPWVCIGQHQTYSQWFALRAIWLRNA